MTRPSGTGGSSLPARLRINALAAARYVLPLASRNLEKYLCLKPGLALVHVIFAIRLCASERVSLKAREEKYTNGFLEKLRAQERACAEVLVTTGSWSVVCDIFLSRFSP